MEDARAELIARAAARGRKREALDYFAERADATEEDRLRAELDAARARLAAVRNLAEEWENDDHPEGWNYSGYLRAALDAVPAAETCPNPLPCERPDVCRYTCGPEPAPETGSGGEN